MSKQQIRSSMRNINRNVNELRALELSKSIFSQIERSATFSASHTIALYAALADELPTLWVIERWYSMGKVILLPRIEADDRMEFYPYSNSLTTGKFGISEPESVDCEPYEPYKIDMMIVPGVAFCRDGRRMGRGRGYYDRYLAREGFVARTIGVCFPHQILDSIPCEAHDVRLDEVISERDHIECAAPQTIPSIILSVIEAAGVDANRLGCSVERLNRLGLSWVLLNLTIEMQRAPEAGEQMQIETWISGCNRVMSTRDFILYNKDGERLGAASTQWCMIDLAARKAVNLIEAEINYPQHVQNRPSEITIARRLPPLDPEQPIAESQHLATERDIDFNNHVNTIRYIEMMLDTLPPERQQRVAPLRVSLNFQSESLLGNILSVKSQNRTNTEEYIFEIVRQDGVTSVKALFTWLE